MDMRRNTGHFTFSATNWPKPQRGKAQKIHKVLFLCKKIEIVRFTEYL